MQTSNTLIVAIEIQILLYYKLDITYINNTYLGGVVYLAPLFCVLLLTVTKQHTNFTIYFTIYYDS